MSEVEIELLDRVRPLLVSHDVPVYLVGGAVRDALLGKLAYDLDFVVQHGAVDLAFAVGDELRVAAYVLDRERDTGRVVVRPDIVLDFARFRGPNLEADLRARDFTINAMAVDVVRHEQIEAGSVIDPCDGLADLKARRVQLTHPSAIEDDPLRALRAVRLAWQLGFELAPEAAAAASETATRLGEMSAERIRDEYLKMLQGPAPHHALRQLADLGLLSVALPEIEALREVQQTAPHHEPVLPHTFSVIRRLLQVEKAISGRDTSADSVDATLQETLSPYAAALQDHLSRAVDGLLDGRATLRLGALFHDVGKAVTASVEEDGRIRFLGHDKEGAAITARRLRRLRLSNEAIAHVRDIVAGHMRPLHLTHAYEQNGQLSRRAVYRFFRDTGDAGIDIVILSFADHLATYDGAGPQPHWRALHAVADRLLMHYFDKYEETVSPSPLLDGNELISALNLKPGPQIGRLLRLIEEAQAVGDVTSKEEALALAKKRLEIGD